MKTKNTKRGPQAQSKAAKIRALLAEGLSVKEIAAKLKFDPNYVATTKWHWQMKNEKVRDERAKDRAVQVARMDAKLTHIKNDPVNSPAHYTDGNVETIAFIEAKKLDYHLGNAVKYISRAGKKTLDETEDLKKAIWYIQRRLDSLNA
jgi:hypothetical protein